MDEEMQSRVQRAKATFRGEYVRWRQIEKTHLTASHAQDRAWAAVIEELFESEHCGMGYMTQISRT